MPRSHADEIVGDYFESEDWTALIDGDAQPELELPPLSPPAAHESAA
jgi:hypothetical protein